MINSIDKNKLSPMMKHFFSIKEQYPDCIILYRLGDFYEMFFSDAIDASKILDIALTGRDCGLEQRAPMCGVPYHSIDTYISKLIKANRKVAICEQLSDPKLSKGIVDRDVVRVITPGTITNDNMLDAEKNNYLLSFYISDNTYSISWVDISTGELKSARYEANDIDNLKDMLLFISPSEVIGNERSVSFFNNLDIVKMELIPKSEVYYEYYFNLDHATESIMKFYKIKSLKALDLEFDNDIICSLGGLIEYLLNTQKTELNHISTPNILRNANKMFLDYNTLRNLELLESLADKSRKGSLLGVLDNTSTSMGARALRKTIIEPYSRSSEINLRLDAIEEIIKNKEIITNIISVLSEINDIERLCNKVAYGSILPRDCRALWKSLISIGRIKDLLKNFESKLSKSLVKKLDSLKKISSLIDDAIVENSPANLREGNFIKKGFHPQLDKYKFAQKNAKEWLANYESSEREKTGLKTLKIGYNRVFGYYFEVSKSYLDKIPEYYERRQTLVSSERFVTSELKQMEETILNSEEKALEIELEIFNNIKKVLLDNILAFQNNSKAIAEIDILFSLAIVSINNKYVKPIINQSVKNVLIKNGRHPVIEDLNASKHFVPNDIVLDNECSTMIITGPNMGGKSTFMRQLALIVLLAHIGCYVPADSAEICIFDRIFTRVGASDNLAFGQSTFMVEMTEVTNIINNATKNSLIILDEIGRGTSTLDGLSIAWAVVEYIATTLKAKTLVATHYHELSELENIVEKTKNYHVLIHENDNKILFLYKISRGSTSKSFGIEVAEMSGLKTEIIERAKTILQTVGLEHSNDIVNKIILQPSKNIKPNLQLSLFDSDPRLIKVESIIKDTDLNNCTPIQAITILNEISRIIKGENHD